MIEAIVNIANSLIRAFFAVAVVNNINFCLTVYAVLQVCIWPLECDVMVQVAREKEGNAWFSA